MGDAPINKFNTKPKTSLNQNNNKNKKKRLALGISQKVYLEPKWLRCFYMLPPRAQTPRGPKKDAPENTRTKKHYKGRQKISRTNARHARKTTQAKTKKKNRAHKCPEEKKKTAHPTPNKKRKKNNTPKHLTNKKTDPCFFS